MTVGAHNRLPDAIRRRAMQMIKDGYTTRQTAQQLGISESTITQWKHQKKVEATPELPEGVRMLQAWPRRAAATVRGVSGNE